MCLSNRINRYFCVYRLAILGLLLPLFVHSGAAHAGLFSNIKQGCESLLGLHEKVAAEKGLVWAQVRDGLGEHDIALLAAPDGSQLILREKDGGTSIIPEDDVRYESNLNRYLLHREITVNGVGVFQPKVVNGRIVLEAQVKNGLSELEKNYAQFPKLQFDLGLKASAGRIRVHHIPTLNLVWKEAAKLKLVPVDEDEIDEFTYLEYLLNGKVPISLRDNFVHDLGIHARGLQYLASNPAWWRLFIENAMYLEKHHEPENPTFVKQMNLMTDFIEQASQIFGAWSQDQELYKNPEFDPKFASGEFRFLLSTFAEFERLSKAK